MVNRSPSQAGPPGASFSDIPFLGHGNFRSTRRLAGRSVTKMATIATIAAI